MEYESHLVRRHEPRVVRLKFETGLEREWNGPANVLAGLCVVRDKFTYACLGFPIDDIKVRTEEGGSFTLRFLLLVTVPHLETGEPIQVRNDFAMSMTYFSGRDRDEVARMILEFLHRQLVDAARHEVDEGFRFGGLLVRDPHRNESAA